jgi:bifunctional non-homologous end joining protein LigD
VRIGGRDLPLADRDNVFVRITNEDKVFFPSRGLTKGDLVEYYVDLADALLPHVRKRPAQMKRYPNGVDGEFFYQKRAPTSHPEWLETFRIEFPSGRSADFAVLNDAASLAWFANLGCIEIHTWHSRIDRVERPDYLLIDLDPSADDQWPHVREIALVVKDVMDELGLASYPKTSGSTGMHILAPIERDLDFPEVRRFAKAMAKEIEKRVPRIATTTWAVKDRTGVFVDYGQNARDRTIASAYSIRPVPDARASAPLRWKEVADVDPGDFTMTTMRERLRKVGDLTEDMWDHATSIPPLFERLGIKPPGKGPQPRKRSGPPRDWRAEHEAKKRAKG